MRRIALLSCVVFSLFMSGCSQDQAKNSEISYEQKYIWIKYGDSLYKNDNQFGRYYIFHKDGTFDDCLKDGYVFSTYKYYVDSIGDCYYYYNGYPNNIYKFTISKDCCSFDIPNYLLCINENSPMYTSFNN